jgi:hypothetical protein
MTNSLRRYALLVYAIATFSASGFAQKYEVHPLVGRTAPAKWADAFSLKSVSIVGVKASVFADQTTQVEGEFEYLPHFEFEGTDPKARALVWGINASRNILARNSPNLVPFFSFGVGGVTAHMDSPDSFTTRFPNRSITIDSNDTFLALSYGGGIKALRLYGPAGLRANVLGRTMPNFFNRANSWLELSGGLIFTWGEK